MLQFWQDAYLTKNAPLPTGTPNGRLDWNGNGVYDETRRQYAIFDFFARNWWDVGGNAIYAIPWYLTGEFSSSTGTDVNYLRDGAATAGFFKNVYAGADDLWSWNYDYSTGASFQDGDFRYYNYGYDCKTFDLFSECVINVFDVGAAVIRLAVQLSSDGSHAITLWGVDYNDAGDITKVYFTDSDDGVERLCESALYVDANGKAKMSNYYDAEILELCALSTARFFPIPEPSTFGLFAGTRRKRF